MSDFFQTPPTLGNQYDGDSWLKMVLQWRLPQGIYEDIEPGLRLLGSRVAGEMLDLARTAEREIPRHIPYDAWGRRTDEIKVSPAWSALESIAAEEGIVATGYERRYGSFSRLIQFAKLHLYHPSSALFSCPLAMTDGAARILELLGTPALKDRAYRRLISRSPAEFWTSGQWMTEKTGGSDVSETSTVARKEGDNYRLYGTKWFTSSVTSQMALALARIEGAPLGSKGLSLFYVETRKSNGELNHIEIHRLKDKLGTRALPTAELTLHGCEAELLGQPGDGIRNISTMLNITRLYNSVCATAQMRRALALVAEYSRVRKVFGQALEQQPAFQMTYAEMDARYVSSLMLTMHSALLLGKQESGEISERESHILRLLTPVVKLMTGKWAVSVASESVEAFGGAGYMEDSGIPVLLRDAQVLPIWEGPTNVLALDVLRVLQKRESLNAFLDDLDERARSASDPLKDLSAPFLEKLKSFKSFMDSNAGREPEFWLRRARSLAFNLGRLMTMGLLIELGSRTKGQLNQSIIWWSQHPLVKWPIVPFDGPSNH